MRDEADYSLYKCPFSHIEKECGHELHGPEGYENTHGVWCACGFRGPTLCLDPVELRLESRMPGHDECVQENTQASASPLLYAPDLDKDISFLREMKEIFYKGRNGNGWDRMRMEHLGIMISDWLFELKNIQRAAAGGAG